MSLIQHLRKVKPRENSGSVSSSRFDFQKDWSLCKLLQLHLSGKDYLLVFEFHDDLIEFNDEHKPDKISFYQIKTSSKNHWTVNNLLYREEGETGKKLSFLGKLYMNKLNFSKFTESLNFISNIPFKVKLKGQNKESIQKEVCISLCDDTQIQKIGKQLQEEHSLEKTIDFAEVTFLRNAELHLADSETHALGKLTKFLSEKFPNKLTKPDVVYRVIVDEIKRRTNTVLDVNDFEEVKNKKGIGRSFFEEMLNSIGVAKDFDSRWNTISTRFNSEGVDPREIDKIQKAWREYEINLMDNTNYTHVSLCEVINKIVSILLVGKLTIPLTSFVDKVLFQFKESSFYLSNPKLYTDEYLKAVILGSFYEQ